MKRDLIISSIFRIISYLAFFPQKNFTKIQLNTPENQHAVHYLDKRFIDERNLLCVLSVSEFNSKKPYKLWGVEEMMANYIFEFFIDWIDKQNSDLADIKDFGPYIIWVSEQVEDFFEDWKEAREKRAKSAQKITQTNVKKKIAEDSEKSFEHWWDIQLINEAGLPVSHVLSFLDDESFYYMDENENASQNITSMSISALKYVIDEHGGNWNIEYLKSELNNEMGYQYTFFKKFAVVKNNQLLNFMLIMNSALFNLKTQKYVQVLTGKEIPLLNKVAARLKLNSHLFSEDALLIDIEKDQEKIHSILLQCVEEEYKKA